jgi:hypothetical protein
VIIALEGLKKPREEGRPKEEANQPGRTIWNGGVRAIFRSCPAIAKA